MQKVLNRRFLPNSFLQDEAKTVRLEDFRFLDKYMYMFIFGVNFCLF